MRGWLTGLALGVAMAAAVLRATRLRHTMSAFGSSQVDDPKAAGCIDVASPQLMGDRDHDGAADIIPAGASLLDALPGAQRSGWCYLYLTSDKTAAVETARIIDVCRRFRLDSIHPDPEAEANNTNGRRRYAALLRDLRAEFGGRIIHQGQLGLLTESVAPLVHAYAPMLYGISGGGDRMPMGPETDTVLRRVWAERIGRARSLGVAEVHPTIFIPGTGGSPTLPTLLDLVAEHRPAGIEWFGNPRLSQWPVRHFTAATRAARGL
jgi:hypothetical protein